jgi:hypothetical protein
VERAVRDYLDELGRYVSSAGRHAYGTYPIDMTPMGYVSGALSALERLHAISEPELEAALMRYHDTFGLKPLPRQGSRGPGVTAEAWKPEWRDMPPPTQ